MPEIHFSDRLSSMTGSIQYSLTNDAVFHIAMEDSPMVSLRGLLSSLLQIPAEEITSVEIKNPIDIETAMSKELILDIKAELNHCKTINIELQTYYDSHYRDRALLYLCRSYDNLNRGDDYAALVPAIHISIMTYSLFPENRRFYSRYRLTDVKNGHLYTPDFELNVLDLSQAESATETDIRNHLDFWAKLFLCRTWEDLREVAAEDPVYWEVAESMAKANLEDPKVSLARYHDRYMATLRGQYEAGKMDGVAESQQKIQEQSQALQEKDQALQEKDQAIEEKNQALQEKNQAIEEKNQTIEEQGQVIQEKNQALQEKDQEIEKLREEIRKMKESPAGNV